MSIEFSSQDLSNTCVSTRLNVLVKVGKSLFFGMIGSVVSVVGVIVVVQDFFSIFEHSERMISGRANSNMDGASSVGVSQDLNGWFQVMGLVEDISEHIGPRISVSGHFDRSLWRKPYFFSKRNLIWNTCQRSNETSPGEVSMNVKFRVRRMVDNDQGVFANRILIIPIQGSHVKGLSILCCLIPDTSHSAGSLDEFREEVES